MGWQGLFIVSGVGMVILFTGVGLQLLQLAYSFWKRKENRDLTGDPWDGRTLEWSTASPAPEYNFAVIPTVTSRDAFWETKRYGKKLPKQKYEDIELPKNTPIGLFIGAAALTTGFAIVWHIYWLAPLGLLSAILLVIIRTTNDDTVEVIPAATVKKLEQARGRAA
jgi:cytochrome o ubiquinol oxidase subunit 1